MEKEQRGPKLEMVYRMYIMHVIFAGHILDVPKDILGRGHRRLQNLEAIGFLRK
jgi:hypothetical protein